MGWCDCLPVLSCRLRPKLGWWGRNTGTGNTKIDTFRLRVDHLGHLGYQSKLYAYHQPFPDSGWTWKVPVRSKKTEHMWKTTYVKNLKKMNRLFDKVRGAKWPHWRPLSNHTLKITFLHTHIVVWRKLKKWGFCVVVMLLFCTGRWAWTSASISLISSLILLKGRALGTQLPTSG